MKIIVDEMSDGKIIRPHGKIDILTSAELRSMLNDLTKKESDEYIC